jgi:hypothetical protein
MLLSSSTFSLGVTYSAPGGFSEVAFISRGRVNFTVFFSSYKLALKTWALKLYNNWHLIKVTGIGKSFRTLPRMNPMEATENKGVLWSAIRAGDHVFRED